jgi:cytidylate kinase
MAPRIVAIDGPAGSGKSTLAHALAGRLDLPYVNTGLMYRAVAAASISEGIAADDAPALAGLAGRLRFTLTGEPPSLEVEGWPEAALTTPEVEARVSAVARHPAVRAVLRDEQRRLGREGAVMEGRDIGSVVFPDAAVKLFLRAGPAARAARRAAERRHDPARTGAAVGERDAADARTHPLEPAPGAIVVDTGALDVDATLEAAIRVVRERAPGLVP